MTTALTTFLFKGEVEKSIDLDISLSISVEQCLGLLKKAHWLPEHWDFKCEASGTGESWEAIGQQVLLAEVIQGDGAIVRIIPY